MFCLEYIMSQCFLLSNIDYFNDIILIIYFWYWYILSWFVQQVVLIKMNQ